MNSPVSIESVFQLVGVARYDDAKKMAQQFLAQYPESAVGWAALAYVLIQGEPARAQLKEAVDAASHSIGLDPTDEFSYRMRALALWQLKRHRKALESARRAVELEPEGSEPLAVYAQLLSVNRKHRKARQVGEELVKLFPADAATYQLLGYLDIQKARWRSAKKNLEKARTIEPADPDILHNLGIVYRKLGKDEEAVDVLHSAVQLNPASESTREQLGASLGSYLGGGLFFVVIALMASIQGGIGPIIGAGIMMIGVAILIRRYRRWRRLHGTLRKFFSTRVRTETEVTVMFVSIVMLWTIAIVLLIVAIDTDSWLFFILGLLCVEPLYPLNAALFRRGERTKALLLTLPFGLLTLALVIGFFLA